MAIARLHCALGQSPSSQPTRHSARWDIQAHGRFSRKSTRYSICPAKYVQHLLLRISTRGTDHRGTHAVSEVIVYIDGTSEVHGILASGTTPLGTRWEQVGCEKPIGTAEVSNEIQNTALATALKDRVIYFSKVSSICNLLYRVVYSRRIPYLYRSFSAKEPYS